MRAETATLGEPKPVPAVPPRAGPFLRKGLLAVVDQAVGSGTSFATSVFIGRLGSQEDLGVYSLALSLVLFLRGVQGGLVCAPYTIYCSRRGGRALASYSGSALVHYLSLTVLGVVCLLAVAGLLSLGVGPAGAATAVWVLAGVAPFLLLREYARQMSLAHLRLGTVLAIDAGVAVLQVGGLLLLGHLGLLTVGTAYGVTGAACAVACVGWFLARQEPLRFEPAQFAIDWRHNWPFARWALASFLIGSAMSLAMPWVMAVARDEAATGQLAACTSLINCAGMVVTGVANFLTPRAAQAFARGGLDELRLVLVRTASLFAVTLGTFVLLILAAGDLPATLVYGGQYAGCGAILAVLAVQVLVNSMGVTAGNGLWAMERPRANVAADACTFAVTAIAVLVLVPPLGILGAALALLAGTCAGVSLRCVQLLRLMREGRA